MRTWWWVTWSGNNQAYSALIWIIIAYLYSCYQQYKSTVDRLVHISPYLQTKEKDQVNHAY